MTDRSLVKRYFPDGAIPEDFEKWVKAHGLRRHPGSRQAAFAEWVFKKANLKDPYRMTWGKVKEKLKDAQKVSKWAEKATDGEQELAEKRTHFWTKLSLCRCTVLICSTSPYCPHRAQPGDSFGAKIAMEKWSKAIFASTKSQSYFQNAVLGLDPAGDKSERTVIMKARQIGQSTLFSQISNLTSKKSQI